MNKLFNIFHPYHWVSIPKLNNCLAKEKKLLADEAEKSCVATLKNQPTYANILMSNLYSTHTSITRKTFEGMFLIV